LRKLVGSVSVVGVLFGMSNITHAEPMSVPFVTEYQRVSGETKEFIMYEGVILSTETAFCSLNTIQGNIENMVPDQYGSVHARVGHVNGLWEIESTSGLSASANCFVFAKPDA